MKFWQKLSVVLLFLIFPDTSKAASAISSFNSISVTRTNFQSESIVTNGITIGGVRLTAWPSGSGDVLAANGMTNLSPVLGAGGVAVQTTNAAGFRVNVGLGNVDNTSDANKPVSSATQTALDLKAPIASPTFTGTATVPSLNVTTGISTPLLQTSSLVFSNAFKGNQVTLAYDSFGTNMVMDLNAGNQFWATLTTHTKFYITNWPTLGTTNCQPITLHVWENATGGYRALWSETNFVFDGYSSELNSTNANARNTLSFAVGAGLTNLVYIGTPAPAIPWPIGGTNLGGGNMYMPLGAAGMGAMVSLTLGNGRLHATPFNSKAGGVLTNLVLPIVTAASAGGVCRVGLYDDSGRAAPFPGTLIVDGGEQATTNSATDLYFPVNVRLLPNRRYWTSVFVGVANPVVRSYAAASQEPWLGYNGTNANANTYLFSTTAYGVLPSAFPTTGISIAGNAGTGSPAIMGQFTSSP